MCRVGFGDSRRNVQMNVEGENTLRGGKHLQLPFLYQGRCSITVMRRLPGLSSGRSDAHSKDPSSPKQGTLSV